MTDPRKGLQKRYDLETILELHKGKPKIQGLNYDAPAMLRNPLYVKMGQELRSESQDQTNRILTQTEQMNNIRRLASERDLPHDLLSEFHGFDDDNMGPPPPPQGGSSQGDSMDTTPDPPRFGDDKKHDDPPPPDSMAPNSNLFRSNLEIQAELHALKAEMQKRQQHDNIIREVRQTIVNNNTNPIK